MRSTCQGYWTGRVWKTDGDPMRALLAALVLSVSFSCSQQQSSVSSVGDSIYDSAGVLNTQQRDSISGLIKNLRDSIGSQMAVIIIESLRGREINSYSMQQAEKFRFGREGYDDGILVTVAMADRQMRIEVGIGLELIIKDEIASRIIRNVVAPKFRAGRFGLGIYKGLDSIRFLIERDRQLVGKPPR